MAVIFIEHGVECHTQLTRDRQVVFPPPKNLIEG